LLKIIGAIGGVLSFLLVLNQVTGVLQTFRVHHKEFREAMNVGQQEQEREDYPAAFASFKHAVELDPIDRKAQEQETKAAMLWLENAHSNASQSFTDIVNQTLPVLDRALANAKGTAAADILAHIGLANFLRYRANAGQGAGVDQSLQQALAIDKNNPYGNAILGLWTLWQHGSIDAASAHFAAGLASGRERAYVRSLQVVALSDTYSDDGDKALLQVANDMRKNGEALSKARRAEALQGVIGVRVSDHARLLTVLAVLPPPEILATFDWLNDGDNNHWDNKWAFRPFIEANLDEMSGQPVQALAIYQTLRKGLAGTNNSLGPQVEAAIKRLSSK
jgi:tetratricopeptide (TPR) repeat protein